MREAVHAFLHDALLRPAADGAPRVRVAEPGFRAFGKSELAPLLAACPTVRLDAGTMATEHLARRARVGGLAELAAGLDLQVVPQAIDWFDDAAAAWRRGSVQGDGVPIELRCRLGTQPDSVPFTVVIDPLGMLHAQTAAPAWLQELPRPVLVEPRPYGGWAEFRAAWQRNGILLGRGEGYQAALDTARVCASLPGTAAVHVMGLGEAGVVALLAAHLCPRIVRVQTDDLGEPYAANGNRLPLCPELLRFRDLPELIRTLPTGCVHATWRRPAGH
jgi:hypothetical protein